MCVTNTCKHCCRLNIVVVVYQHVLMRLFNTYISVVKDPCNASIGNAKLCIGIDPSNIYVIF
jgi:hypothetical protein